MNAYKTFMYKMIKWSVGSLAHLRKVRSTRNDAWGRRNATQEKQGCRNKYFVKKPAPQKSLQRKPLKEKVQDVPGAKLPSALKTQRLFLSLPQLICF